MLQFWDSDVGGCMKRYGLVPRRAPWLLIFALVVAGCVIAQQSASFSASHSGKNEFVIKNAILLTTTHGRVENGSVYVKDGKIVAFGANVLAPSTVTVVDAEGKYITPG